MEKLTLKYGLNPHQAPACLSMTEGPLPLRILSGRPGYINFLDALNAWQLVQELQEATGLVAAASFKHVSPSGVGVGFPLPESLERAYFVEDLRLSPLAMAYARARGADRLSSYGDWVALSAPCDRETAELLAREVSDGVIAPGYSQEALDILRKKRKGAYNVVEIDPHYVPKAGEGRDVFGITFHQGRNTLPISREMFQTVVTQGKTLPDRVVIDMLIAQISLKYTQSNSVCYVLEGQTIGIGAGQQSRIHCTRLAGQKADIWRLRQHPTVLDLPFRGDLGRPERDNAIDIYLSEEGEDMLEEGEWQKVFTRRPGLLSREEKRAWISALTGVTVGSDAFFPFSDNVERARKSGTSYIVQPGGSVRDNLVIQCCDAHGIVMVFTGQRLFHH